MKLKVMFYLNNAGDKSVLRRYNILPYPFVNYKISLIVHVQIKRQ